jgi:hypothetical protein
MMPPVGAERLVEIRPPSLVDETLAVARAAMAVILLAGLCIAVQSGPSADRSRSGLLPFQSSFGELAPEDQRLFRQLEEGLLEAENRRAADGVWPSAEALAALGVPPFTPDPIARGAYRWAARGAGRGGAGAAVDYLGLPEPGSGRRPFLLLVQENGDTPPPGRKPILDETHHQLASGDLIHVSIWIAERPEPVRDGLIDKPFQESWTQITVNACCSR